MVDLARHTTFVSFHSADHARKQIFDLRFGNRFGAIVPGSVNVGDIADDLPEETIRRKIRDEYLRGTTVTVVLVGVETWQRKHVDWEIASSVRDAPLSGRSGLLGVLLPSYREVHGRGQIDVHTLPARLADNVTCGYAKLYDWSEKHDEIAQWVHEAFLVRKTQLPDQSRPLMRRNSSGDRWW